MDTRDTRRELGRSIRLLGDEERWLFLGLIVGAAGYLIWLAGTGVAVDRVLGSYSVDPWSTEATALAATFAVLWVLLPSVAAVRYVVGNVTNLRGNVEQRYRFDRPLVALVPSLALLVVAVAVGAYRGVATWYVLAALAVANTVLLVRTVAYGYRVYSFSAPRLLQGLVFVSAAVATTAAVTRASDLAGQTPLVEAVAARYGVADIVFGTVSRAGVSAPVLPLAAVAAPAVLALAYVWVQLFASLVVRIRRPDVPRSAIRAGQRYPEVVRPGTTDRLAMGTASDGGGGETEIAPGDLGSTAADESAGGSSAGAAQAGDAASASDDGAGAAADERAENVGQTRVFTPPDDVDEPGVGADATRTVSEGESGAAEGDATKNEFCPICGETYAADAGHTNCPNCNAVLDES